LFGEIQNYFFVSEFQSGGLAHDHGLLWVQNAHQFAISSNESIEKYVDKYSTTNQTSQKTNRTNLLISISSNEIHYNIFSIR